MDILSRCKKYNHMFALAVFGIFYLVSFILLEKRDVPIHVVHCGLDDMIPFCEYFIIPYFLWFLFVGATVYYFGIIVKDKEECMRLFASLGLGMTLFLVISLVYPNGHLLRPSLEGEGIFIKLVQFIYTADTSTNILPSLHVFETVVCFIAIVKNDSCRKKKGLCTGLGILSLLIILSTVFLKQHSVIDVLLAINLNVVCYILVYVKSVKPELKSSGKTTRKVKESY